jgi:hypothetical protein
MNTVTQRVSLFVQSGDALLSNVFLFNFSTYAINANFGIALNLDTGVSGRSPTAGAYGVSMSNGVRVFAFAGAVLNLEGASGAVRFRTATAETLTWAQFAYWGNDGAISGLTTLVAGASSVTVPYASTSRPVICSHESLAGTPGIVHGEPLGATSLYFSSTSATDTSIIGWMQPPAGRSISFAWQ